MKGIDIDKLLREKQVITISSKEALKDTEPYPLSYEQKYKYVIARLRYAMDSYFKDMKEITDDEIIQTACDYLSGHLTREFQSHVFSSID